MDYDEDFERLVAAQRQGTLLAMQDIALEIALEREAQRNRQQVLDMLPALLVLVPAMVLLAYVWAPILRAKFWNFLFGG